MQNYLKFVGTTLGRYNGKVFFSLNGEIIVFDYVTPLFNDYNEWRISVEVLDNTISEDNFIPQLMPFEIDTTTINIKTLIKDCQIENCIDQEDLYGLDNILTYVEYRKPTDDEMKDSKMSIEDYNIGKFLTIFNLTEDKFNDMIKLEDFKPQNEVEKIALIVLLTIVENHNIIYNSQNLILF